MQISVIGLNALAGNACWVQSAYGKCLAPESVRGSHLDLTTQTPTLTPTRVTSKYFLRTEYSIFTNQAPNMSRRLSLIPYVESPDIDNLRTYLDEGAVSSLLS
jgi:hypothetical protein